MGFGHTKKSISDKIINDLRRLESDISGEIGKSEFNPVGRIKSKYPMYYVFPEKMNPYIKKRLDSIHKRYDIPLPDKTKIDSKTNNL